MSQPSRPSPWSPGEVFGWRREAGERGRDEEEGPEEPPSRAGGSPAWLLALVAIAAIVGVLVAVFLINRSELRGYAEFQAERGACFLVPGKSHNAIRCRYVSPNVYAITFARDVDGSVAIATRGTCCPGDISASVVSARRVLVALTGQTTYPVRAQVFVP